MRVPITICFKEGHDNGMLSMEIEKHRSQEIILKDTFKIFPLATMLEKANARNRESYGGSP